MRLRLDGYQLPHGAIPPRTSTARTLLIAPAAGPCSTPPTYTVYSIQYPVSSIQESVSRIQESVSRNQYQGSRNQYPVSSIQYPVFRYPGSSYFPWGYTLFEAYYRAVASQTLGKTAPYTGYSHQAPIRRRFRVPTCGYEHVKTAVSGQPIYRHTYLI